MKKNPILITGAHRSGTTWVGNIVSRSPKMHYVHEPFNLDVKRDNCPIKYWFEYVHAGMEEEEREAIIQYLEKFMRPGPKDIAKNFLKIRSMNDLSLFMGRFLGLVERRTVFKDPIALMASEFFYKEMDCDIVVLIRHPAAFVASIKMKNWRHDFNGYLNQPALMERYLSKYREDYKHAVASPPDIIDVGILQWKTLYGTVREFQKKYNNDWFFAKHEDLSIAPLETFQKMFSFLDIPFDKETKKEIMSTTTAKNSSQFKRDSASNVKSWKSRLTVEEIDRVREGTSSLWPEFYTEQDWN